jgi:hypothetical protein
MITITWLSLATTEISIEKKEGFTKVEVGKANWFCQLERLLTPLPARGSGQSS